MRAQEVLAENSVKKTEAMAFRCGSGLNSQFWLGNVVFLPSPGGKGERNGKLKLGIVSKTVAVKLFSRNVEKRNVGECAERSN